MELQETPEAQVNEIIEIPTTIRNLEPKPHLFMTFQEFLALPRTPMKDSKVIINLSGKQKLLLNL